jgi:hypothetical protein
MPVHRTTQHHVCIVTGVKTSNPTNGDMNTAGEVTRTWQEDVSACDWRKASVRTAGVVAGVITTAL